MKNIVLSAVAVLAMSSFAVAGGDIAPVEEPVVVPEPVVTDAGFYLGAAYGLLSTDQTRSTQLAYGELSYGDRSDNYSMLMLDAGYKFNQYVAIEGRYWIGLDDNSWDASNGTQFLTKATGNVDSWGIYVKPMYPVTDAFDIYALLGYASSDYTIDFDNGFTYNSDNLDGFSWGLGAAYSFTDNLSVFVDYVLLYNDTYTANENGYDVDYDDTLQTWNFGLNYKF